VGPFTGAMVPSPKMVPVGTADTPSPVPPQGSLDPSGVPLVPGTGDVPAQPDPPPGDAGPDGPATDPGEPDGPGNGPAGARVPSGAGPSASPADADGPGKVSGNHRWWVVPTANAVVLLLVLGGVVLWVLSDGGWHRPLRTAPEKQHPAPASQAPTDALPTGSSWPDLPAQPVVDGADPQRANCDMEVSTLTHRDLALASGKILGRIELRYSSKCNTSWARFAPAAGFVARRTLLVSVRTRRPQEGARSPASVAFGARPITDVMLMADRGCVTASATLTENTRVLAQATTDCLEPDS